MPQSIGEVKLVALIWNWLYQKIAGFELPEKIGEKEKYTKDQRMVVKWEAMKAEQELKAHSHYANLIGSRNMLIFGAKEDWVKAGEEYTDSETGEKKIAVGRNFPFEH